MSERISVGDLVQVVGQSACPKATKNDSIGLIFSVLNISSRGTGFCRWCGLGVIHTINGFAEGPDHWYGLHRLKRIPPLSELEGVRTQETIKEKA